MTTEFDKIMDDVKTEEENMSDFYKIVEGDQKVRILSDFIKVESVFNNKTPAGMNYPGRKIGKDEKISMKGWCWAIIRKTGDIKILQLPKTLLKQIMALKYGEEYGFDSFPMPYDITITAKGAGTKEVDYQTTPSRQNTDITEEEMNAFNEKTPLKDIAKSILNKQLENQNQNTTIEYPESPNPDEVAF